MKTKIKKITYWSSVIVVGLVFGFSLQLVKAWTEPSSTPPTVNVGAPINTGISGQVKSGALGVSGVLNTYYDTFLATDGGNVGIGTTSPGYKLHVVGNAYIAPSPSGRYLFTSNSTSGYTTTFDMNNTGLYIGHNSASRLLNLRTHGQDRLSITGAGDVGIGTTSPTAKLEVIGKIKSSPTVSSDGQNTLVTKSYVDSLENYTKCAWVSGMDCPDGQLMNGYNSSGVYCCGKSASTNCTATSWKTDSSYCLPNSSCPKTVGSKKYAFCYISGYVSGHYIYNQSRILADCSTETRTQISSDSCQYYCPPGCEASSEF